MYKSYVIQRRKLEECNFDVKSYVLKKEIEKTNEQNCKKIIEDSSNNSTFDVCLLDYGEARGFF